MTSTRKEETGSPRMDLAGKERMRYGKKEGETEEPDISSSEASSQKKNKLKLGMKMVSYAVVRVFDGITDILS